MDNPILTKIFALFGLGVMTLLFEFITGKEIIPTKDNLIVFLTGFLVIFLAVFMSNPEYIGLEEVITLKYVSVGQVIIASFGVAIWILLAKRYFLNR